ncbi:MAG: hypothetical protein LWY06_06460 [Firmicutes bacterium]|nr:hypothetical protein [Bacillota bacterium]
MQINDRNFGDFQAQSTPHKGIKVINDRRAEQSDRFTSSGCSGKCACGIYQKPSFTPSGCGCSSSCGSHHKPPHYSGCGGHSAGCGSYTPPSHNHHTGCGGYAGCGGYNPPHYSGCGGHYAGCGSYTPPSHNHHTGCGSYAGCGGYNRPHYSGCGGYITVNHGTPRDYKLDLGKSNKREPGEFEGHTSSGSACGVYIPPTSNRHYGGCGPYTACGVHNQKPKIIDLDFDGIGGTYIGCSSFNHHKPSYNDHKPSYNGCG